MRLIGVFADPYAGRLRITTSGVFEQGTRRDAGFPTGASNKLVRAVVNGISCPAIDRYAPVTTVDLDYPGGNVAWPIYTDQIGDYFGGGTAQYGFAGVVVSGALIKR